VGGPARLSAASTAGDTGLSIGTWGVRIGQGFQALLGITVHSAQCSLNGARAREVLLLTLLRANGAVFGRPPRGNRSSDSLAVFRGDGPGSGHRVPSDGQSWREGSFEAGGSKGRGGQGVQGVALGPSQHLDPASAWGTRTCCGQGRCPSTLPEVDEPLRPWPRPDPGGRSWPWARFGGSREELFGPLLRERGSDGRVPPGGGGAPCPTPSLSSASSCHPGRCPNLGPEVGREHPLGTGLGLA